MEELFSEIKIGSMQVKNRVAFAPIENGYADAGGMITERLIRFFENCAEHDCGLLFTGSVAVDYDGKGVPSQLEIFDETRWPGLAELADRIHKKGGKAAIQLYHAGRQVGVDDMFTPIGPSAVNCDLFADMSLPKAMDQDELDRIREKFRIAARKSVELGYDLIEVHFAHGYLLHSFLSPHSNHRTDEYGGSLENRMRYPLEVLDAVVQEVGKEVPVGVRVSVEEYLPDGLGFEEAKIVCMEAEKHGAALLSVSAGSYDSMDRMIQPMHIQSGFLREYSRELKKILSIPVMVAGRINTAAMIREVVESKDADIAGVGRGFFADPEVIAKLQDKREEEIFHCVGCNQGCLERIFEHRDIRCIFNPQTGFEGVRRIKKTEKKEKIGIVGAGITGLLLARYVSAAGHEVTIFDEKLGGKLNAMSVPKDRENFRLPIEDNKRALERQGVIWKKERVSSMKDLESYGFDRVFAATGSTMKKIKADRVPVMEASEVMRKLPDADKISVIGGGMIGMETARYLAMAGKNVTIFEKDRALGNGVGSTVLPQVLKELEEHKINVYLEKEIVSEKDVLEAAPETELIIQSFGYVPNETSMHDFPGAVFAGSAKGGMKILECGEDAWKLAEGLFGK